MTERLLFSLVSTEASSPSARVLLIQSDGFKSSAGVAIQSVRFATGCCLALTCLVPIPDLINADASMITIRAGRFVNPGQEPVSRCFWTRSPAAGDPATDECIALSIQLCGRNRPREEPSERNTKCAIKKKGKNTKRNRKKFKMGLWIFWKSAMVFYQDRSRVQIKMIIQSNFAWNQMKGGANKRKLLILFLLLLFVFSC